MVARERERERQTDRQKDRQTDRQTDRETKRRTTPIIDIAYGRLVALLLVLTHPQDSVSCLLAGSSPNLPESPVII